MSAASVIAIDLGASNARISLVRLEGQALETRLIHRFEHAPRCDHAGRLRWNWAALIAGVREGIARAIAAADGGAIASLSCSSWAQDFGLLDERGRLIADPVSYRDRRTEGMPSTLAWPWPLDELIARVGSCASPVTTLCQLRAMRRDEPVALATARTLLPIADLVHHGLCGGIATDPTMASASQLCSLRTGGWDRELLREVDLPADILPPIAGARSRIGDIDGIPVIPSAGHDTAAAAAALGRLEPGAYFLSLGTWSMLGCCTREPQVASRQAASGLATLRMPRGAWSLVRPGVGLRLAQDCRRRWHRDGVDLTHAQLASEARSARVDAIIDLADRRFEAADRVVDEIRSACRERGGGIPWQPAEIAKVVFDSLAVDLARGLRELEAATGQRCERLHLIGGGARNGYLSERLEAELGAPLVIGPPEATTIGNALLQLEAIGALGAYELPELRPQEIAAP